MQKLTTEELQLLYETAIPKSTNLYLTAAGHGAAKDSYLSGIYTLYYHMFGKYPYEFEICQYLEPMNSYEKFTDDDYKFARKYLKKYSKSNRVDFTKTLFNIRNAHKDDSYVVSYGGVNMIIMNQYIVVWNQDASFSILCPNYLSIEDNIKYDCDKIHFLNIAFNGDVFNDDFNLNDYMAYYKVKLPKPTPTYQYVIKTGNGFETTPFPLSDYIHINMEENYNDDFPHEKIVNFLSKEGESGIVILHGIPGTGKSYYIRNLITEMNDKDFLLIHENCLAYIDDPSFLQVLMKHKDAIIVMEDCEHVLIDRETGRNSLITTLLNLSDGIISDAFNLKFICTFNTHISKIDDAIKRKGRMKVQYELGKLSKEKTAALAKKYGKTLAEADKNTEMTLADIYNYEDGETVIGAKKKSIGFTQD